MSLYTQDCRTHAGEPFNLRALRGQVLLVGDGTSDFCVAGRADYVFAKRKLIAHCRDHALAHSAIEGFAEALALLPAPKVQEVALALTRPEGATPQDAPRPTTRPRAHPPRATPFA